MKAIVYQVNSLGWLACKALGRVWPSCRLSRLAGLSLREVPRPALPTEEWVCLRTLMGGICGTDLAILNQRQPADSILQAFSSMPMVLGHENLAVVDEVGPAVDQDWVGCRVCVEPTLSCQVRGIDPPCRQCRSGRPGTCENFDAAVAGQADLPAGTSIGYNSRTGGSLGEYFVAHRSQLVAVPEELSDVAALLTDPAACALHAVLRADLSDARQVAVIGAGVMGLATIACLRATGYAGRIEAIDPAGYLEKLARRLGADAFLSLPPAGPARFDAVAKATGGRVIRSRFGNSMLSDGYDVIFDCVGSAQPFNESLKWSAGGGQVILVGTGQEGTVDLTGLWFKELTVRGACGRGEESYLGRKVETYRLVHELMRAGKLNLTPLLTHTFALEDYHVALEVAINKARHGAVKVAIDFRTRHGA
jgi:threonine dehydrogenase-like Zn-dependent dehydrogenase